jgi:hypothetical protein
MWTFHLRKVYRTGPWARSVDATMTSELGFFDFHTEQAQTARRWANRRVVQAGIAPTFLGQDERFQQPGAPGRSEMMRTIKFGFVVAAIVAVTSGSTQASSKMTVPGFFVQQDIVPTADIAIC